jgi:hypothetical protein
MPHLIAALTVLWCKIRDLGKSCAYQQKLLRFPEVFHSTAVPHRRRDMPVLGNMFWIEAVDVDCWDRAHALISVVASYRQTLVDQRGTSAGRSYWYQRDAPGLKGTERPIISGCFMVKRTYSTLIRVLFSFYLLHVCQPSVVSSGNVAQPEPSPICRAGGQHARLKLLLDQPGFYRVNKSSSTA